MFGCSTKEKKTTSFQGSSKDQAPQEEIKRKRKRSSSSSSTLLSSSAASRSDTDSTQSKGKQKGGLHSTDILKLIRSLQAYIDFGSECTLIRDSDARDLKLNKIFTELPVIKGFGNSMVFPIYRSNANLKLDEVETCAELLVVNDEFMQSALLIGQNVTKLPNVSVYKDNNCLQFYQSPSFGGEDRITKCLKIRILSDNEIQMSGLIEAVTVDPNYSGDIFIEGYCNSEPSKEYYLHRGAYRVDNGKCLLGVTNLSHEKLILLKKGNLIARATPIIEKAVKHISKLSTELPNYEPILIADIKIEIPGFSTRKNKFESVIAVDRIRPWININIPDQNHDENEITDSSSSVSENELDKNIE
ncbi:hypothetical protein ACJJTC_011930 [Scirpophaga incertulas]